jgi:hypothetical protein
MAPDAFDGDARHGAGTGCDRAGVLAPRGVRGGVDDGRGRCRGGRPRFGPGGRGRQAGASRPPESRGAVRRVGVSPSHAPDARRPARLSRVGGSGLELGPPSVSRGDPVRRPAGRALAGGCPAGDERRVSDDGGAGRCGVRTRADGRGCDGGGATRAAEAAESDRSDAAATDGGDPA